MTHPASLGAAPGDASASAVAATRALAQRVGAMAFERLSPAALAVARHCILDGIAVTLRATHEPLVQALCDNVQEEGGRPQALLLGRNLWVSARQAALVNGAASHALDYDDVNIRMVGHPTVAVLPAALALAETTRASGKDLLAAFAAGYETVCLVGAMVAPSHYARGFHVTGTVGTFGAAMACARLLGLDVDRTQAAIGIAATQAAGLKSMFGSMCKPLHAGKANENGLLAAQLAARGFTSHMAALECEQGFAPAHSDTLHPEVMVEGVERFNLPDNLFKYHASCYQTHAAIDGIRRLVEAHRVMPADIDRITLSHDAGADTVCNIAEPVSGLQTKFSLRLLAAYAACGIDTADIDSYTDERTRDPQLVALRDRVTVTLVPDWPITRSVVCLRLRDGRELSTEEDSGVPDRDLERQAGRLVRKMHALLDARMGAARVQRIADTVLALEELSDVGELVELLGPLDSAAADQR